MHALSNGHPDVSAQTQSDTPASHDITKLVKVDGVTPYTGPLINRSKSGLSPFAEIVKTPTYSENSGTLTGYAVEIKDSEAETGFRHIGNVSARYLLLSNAEVRALALEMADRSGMAYEESRLYWDGNRFLHVIDFEPRESVDSGDEVGLGLVTRSSYDKSWRYECALMGRRFICNNGMISGEFFARVSFRHLKSAEDTPWQEVIRQGLSILETAPSDLTRFVDRLRALRAIPMTDATLRQVWQLYPQIGDGIKGQVMSRYVAYEEPTLYGFLNAGSNVFWHRERMTASDFSHNDAFTTALLGVARSKTGRMVA